jgi:hypothetical protein
MAIVSDHCRKFPLHPRATYASGEDRVDPHAWLADARAHIAPLPAHRIDELLPGNWKVSREEALAAEAACRRNATRSTPSPSNSVSTRISCKTFHRHDGQRTTSSGSAGSAKAASRRSPTRASRSSSACSKEKWHTGRIPSRSVEPPPPVAGAPMASVDIGPSEPPGRRQHKRRTSAPKLPATSWKVESGCIDADGEVVALVEPAFPVKPRSPASETVYFVDRNGPQQPSTLVYFHAFPYLSCRKRGGMQVAEAAR